MMHVLISCWSLLCSESSDKHSLVCCVKIQSIFLWFVILYFIDAGFWDMLNRLNDVASFFYRRTNMITVCSSFSCFFNVIRICELFSVQSFSSKSGQTGHCCLFRCTSFRGVYSNNPKHQALTVLINLFSKICISRRDRSHFLFLSSFKEIQVA